MGLFSWFVADDEDKVVAKVDAHDDGSVHEYRYTEPDDISRGHGHYIYKDMDAYEEDDSIWARKEDSEESKERNWYGNGYNLSIEQLRLLKEQLLIQKAYTTSQLILKK